MRSISPKRSMRLALVLLMAAAGLAPASQAAAQAGSRVVCDARVARIVKNMRDEPMTPEQEQRAREALFKAIDTCRPLTSSHGGRRPETSSQDDETRRRVEQGVGTERQSLRVQQDRLSPAEQREGDRRLDDIQRKAERDPATARDMMRIYETDRALATTNRPPGGPIPSTGPGLVSPGER
ncbi:MAG: hypothetical protein ACM33T_02215 [Solirubrobacterales bacterium]